MPPFPCTRRQSTSSQPISKIFDLEVKSKLSEARIPRLCFPHTPAKGSTHHVQKLKRLDMQFRWEGMEHTRQNRSIRPRLLWRCRLAVVEFRNCRTLEGQVLYSGQLKSRFSKEENALTVEASM